MKKVIMISKNGCSPCDVIKPKFIKAMNDDKKGLEWKLLNISENDEAMQFALKYNVKSVPTFLIMDDEQIVFNQVGSRAFVDLIDYISVL